MVTYDKHYREPDYFGDPYPELVQFFSQYEPKGKVLDLGCGQGRDSIALARMGYDVTGVDISRTGVSQMMSVTKSEGLKLNGVVADIYDYKVDDSFDIVLLDSMLHFYKLDKAKETKFLLRIMNELRLGGLLCVFVWKSKSIEKSLEMVLERSLGMWETLVDRYIEYPEKNMKMRMVVRVKIKRHLELKT